jgi:hypothetical protein
MRGMWEGYWIVEVVPEIRLCESPACGQLNSTSVIIGRIQIARCGLKHREDCGKDEAGREQNQIAAQRHWGRRIYLLRISLT